MDLETFVTPIVVALIMGIPAWIAAVNSRQINRAVNHKPSGEPTLYQHAAAVAAGLITLDVQVQRYVEDDAAAHALMSDRLAAIESTLKGK